MGTGLRLRSAIRFWIASEATLDPAGARLKVAQELMRHANIAPTMDIYTGVLERDKREAVGRVARSFWATAQ